MKPALLNTFQRTLIMSTVILLQACTYGFVQNANTGSAVKDAKVTVVKGNCFGSGCSVSPASDKTDASGLYIFDGYATTDAKFISPSSGEEAITLKVSKFGYKSRTIYHRPDYQEYNYKGQKRLSTQVPKVNMSHW